MKASEQIKPFKVLIGCSNKMLSWLRCAFRLLKMIPDIVLGTNIWTATMHKMNSTSHGEINNKIIRLTAPEKTSSRDQ